MRTSGTYSRIRERLARKSRAHALRNASSSTAASAAEAGRPVNARSGAQSGSDAVEMTVSQARFRSWSMPYDRGGSFEDGCKGNKREETHTRFASERCSARTPGREVKSAPGRSVDVRDSTEDRVSMVMAPTQLSTQLLGDWHRPKGVPTCHTVHISSSCSGLVLLREVDVARDVPQNKQMADKKQLPVKSALRSKRVCSV